MKRFSLLIFMLNIISCFAQGPVIERMDAILTPVKHKIPEKTKGLETLHFRDSAFVLRLMLRLKDINEGDKIYLTLGKLKDADEFLKKNIILKYQEGISETLFAYNDDKTAALIGKMNSNFLQLYLPLPFNNPIIMKWLSASIKRNSYESEKTYYEFK